MSASLEDALLALAPAVRLPDRELERLAGLPQGFLAKARRGQHRSPRAAAAWGRLGAWLGAKLGRGVVERAVLASQVKPDDPDPLGVAIESAREPAEAEQLLRRVAASIATGRLDPRRGEPTIAALKTLLRSLREEHAEKQRATLGALELLDADEAEALAARRASAAVEALPAAGIEVMPPSGGPG